MRVKHTCSHSISYIKIIHMVLYFSRWIDTIGMSPAEHYSGLKTAVPVNCENFRRKTR